MAKGLPVHMKILVSQLPELVLFFAWPAASD